MDFTYNPKENNYTLPSGKIIDASNLDSLSTSEVVELCAISPSVYEHLKFRERFHNLENAVSSYVGEVRYSFDEIKSMLMVDLSNGDPHKMSLGKAFEEMYHRETGRRHRQQLWLSIKRNKLMLVIIGSSLVLGATYYFNKTWLLTVLIPFLFSLIKDIFKK